MLGVTTAMGSRIQAVGDEAGQRSHDFIKNRLRSTMLDELVLGVDGVVCTERLA